MAVAGAWAGLGEGPAFDEEVTQAVVGGAVTVPHEPDPGVGLAIWGGGLKPRLCRGPLLGGGRAPQ